MILMREASIRLDRILALHVECGACGDRQRFAPLPWEQDDFTHRVLDPLTSWWVGHLLPAITAFEVLANGEYAEWVASGRSAAPDA